MESADRISNVLLAFTSGDATLGVSEIARRLSLPKSAVHRTLTALCRTGLLRRDADVPRYRLGPRAVELGLHALGHLDIRTAALPTMRDLTDRTQETSTMSLRAGSERFYAAQVESPQDVRMTVDIGRRCPLYAGASGRAILAFLDARELDDYLGGTSLAPLTQLTITRPARLREELAKVRELGYAASNGERDAWAAAVAAPVFARDGRVIGSISVCGPVVRFTPKVAARFGPLVKESAGRLSSELGV